MARRKAEKVFAWAEFRKWRPVVLRILSDFVDDDVLDEVRSNPPRCFASDYLTWLDNAIHRVRRCGSPDIKSVLVSRLPQHYSLLRAFHGCRPESPESYKAQGILPSNTKQIEETALEILSPRTRVEAVIRQLNEPDCFGTYPDHNKGKVFFCIDQKFLVEQCGHYLLYGSEYLASIANHMGRGEELRKRGKATVIECNVPFRNVPQIYVECLVGEILREIFQRHGDPEYYPGLLNFGFPIEVALAPENIVAFHHPSGIPNPHRLNQRED